MASTPITDTNAVFDALERWINKRPGLDFANYGNSLTAYRSELRDIGKDRKRALKALDEARALDPARPDILADSFRAYSGRLQWHGSNTCGCGYSGPCTTCPKCVKPTEPAHLEYCTGQYWPTEYRKAAASVLELYVSSWRQAEAAAKPRTFEYHTMQDVRAANAAIGGHWFDRSTMRFFKTKIESGLIAAKRFITSEKSPSEGSRRLYTIREAKPSGEIDTIGEFQQFTTRDKARAHVLMEKPGPRP